MSKLQDLPRSYTLKRKRQTCNTAGGVYSSPNSPDIRFMSGHQRSSHGSFSEIFAGLLNLPSEVIIKFSLWWLFVTFEKKFWWFFSETTLDHYYFRKKVFLTPWKWKSKNRPKKYFLSSSGPNLILSLTLNMKLVLTKMAQNGLKRILNTTLQARLNKSAHFLKCPYLIISATIRP